MRQARAKRAPPQAPSPNIVQLVGGGSALEAQVSGPSSPLSLCQPGQLTIPLHTKCPGMQSPESPGHKKSHSPLGEALAPSSSVSLLVIRVPSGLRGRWKSSVHAILKAARAGVMVPINWILTDGDSPGVCPVRSTEVRGGISFELTL